MSASPDSVKSMTPQSTSTDAALVRHFIEAPDAPTLARLEADGRRVRPLDLRLFGEPWDRIGLAEQELRSLPEEDRFAFWYVETFPGGPRDLVQKHGTGVATALFHLHKYAQRRAVEAAPADLEPERHEDDFYGRFEPSDHDPFGEVSAGQVQDE
jgi:hypothetical protein